MVLDWWWFVWVYGFFVGFFSDEDMGNSEVGYNVFGVGWIFI